MSKEAIKDVQPRGVCWTHAADYESRTVRSEAYFKMTQVAKIRDMFLGSGGNLQKTVSTLNSDLLPDEGEFGIKPEEVVELVDWASRNEVSLVRKINDKL